MRGARRGGTRVVGCYGEAACSCWVGSWTGLGVESVSQVTLHRLTCRRPGRIGSGWDGGRVKVRRLRVRRVAAAMACRSTPQPRLAVKGNRGEGERRLEGGWKGLEKAGRPEGGGRRLHGSVLGDGGGAAVGGGASRRAVAMGVEGVDGATEGSMDAFGARGESVQ